MPYLRASPFYLAMALVVFVDASDGSAQTSTTSPRSSAQLEQLVAPIALHPDALLSQILMAATYPTEVVQAARWAKANPSMSPPTLQGAIEKQPWDPSVKSLTAVPQVLEMMNDQLDWTVQLGDAFLAQQEDVLAAVQRLRQRADAAGKLQSTREQKVTKEARPSSNGGAQIITIGPTDPDVLYVPVYDPSLVYGDWPYPDYVPFYWHPPGYYGTGVLSFAAAAANWGVHLGRRELVE